MILSEKHGSTASQEDMSSLKEYVRECKVQGLPDETIRERLLDAGWREETVTKALLPAILLEEQKPRPQKGECMTCGKKVSIWWRWGLPVLMSREIGQKWFCSRRCQQEFISEFNRKKQEFLKGFRDGAGQG